MTARRLSTTSDSNWQHGFSLLEVLVAVVVLSLGLLGLAALQITSLQGGHGAHLRAQAALLAYDMGDRVRANSANLGAYATGFGGVACDDDLEPAGTVAQQDVAEWLNSLACLLPGGQGGVAVGVVGGLDTVDIRIDWVDRQGAVDGATDGRFDFRVQL